MRKTKWKSVLGMILEDRRCSEYDSSVICVAVLCEVTFRWVDVSGSWLAPPLSNATFRSEHGWEKGKSVTLKDFYVGWPSFLFCHFWRFSQLNWQWEPQEENNSRMWGKTFVVRSSCHHEKRDNLSKLSSDCNGWQNNCALSINKTIAWLGEFIFAENHDDIMRVPICYLLTCCFFQAS